MASERIEKLKRRPAMTPAQGVITAAAIILPPMEVLDPPEKVKPAKPPKADKPTVTRKCGHKQGLADLEGSYCTACQGKRRRDNNAARRAKWEAKRQSAQADDRGRLPMGSTFDVSYDAERKVWDGTLSVYRSDVRAGKVFRGTHSGVFKLLSSLDAQYRAWLAG